MAERGTDELVIRGGTVVDGAKHERADVAVSGGVIVEVGLRLEVPTHARVLDAGGCIVAPGFVDLHAHLREPGGEEAETIESGTRGAALGGFTAVIAMPNTMPPIDSAQTVRYVQSAAAGALAQVSPAGAISVGRKGERLSPMGEMADLGVKIFTDDGTGVQDPLLMRRAMEYAKALDATVAEHCEDARLAAGGHMHEGEISARLGIPGIPSEAEEVMAARDIALARLTGARLHLLHVSTAGSVALVEGAKAAGIAVTAEVTPHHLSLTDDEVCAFDPRFKVNPPLRSHSDVCALVDGLRTGVLDAVATDHAPHPADSKELPFDSAPPGMLGFETALAVLLSVLMSGRGMTPGPEVGVAMNREEAINLVVSAMSVVPARIAGLASSQGGPVVSGRPAHLCVFDPDAAWVVPDAPVASRSGNTPYAGRSVIGQVRHTVFGGEAVVIDGVAQR